MSPCVSLPHTVSHSTAAHNERGSHTQAPVTQHGRGSHGIAVGTNGKVPLWGVVREREW